MNRTIFAILWHKFFLKYALWRYRNVHVSSGGPIAKITLKEREREVDAFAWLEQPLRKQQKLKIYDDVDGTGTGESAAEATCKAVSEALERWAFYSASESNSMQFGFNKQRTTNGMAAHPGPSKLWARENALAEAIERWTLAQLWYSKIAAVIESESLEPQSETFKVVLPRHYFYLMSRRESAGWVYGFGCAQRESDAHRKAKVELSRNERVLRRYFTSGSVNNANLSEQERRLVYFSTAEGHEVFRSRVLTAPVGNIVVPPKLIIDTEIVGPWSKYACVWRCLFDDDFAYEAGNLEFRF